MTDNKNSLPYAVFVYIVYRFIQIMSIYYFVISIIQLNLKFFILGALLFTVSILSKFPYKILWNSVAISPNKVEYPDFVYNLPEEFSRDLISTESNPTVSYKLIYIEVIVDKISVIASFTAILFVVYSSFTNRVFYIFMGIILSASVAIITIIKIKYIITQNQSSSTPDHLKEIVKNLANKFQSEIPRVIVSSKTNTAYINQRFIGEPEIFVGKNIMFEDIKSQEAVLAHEFAHLVQPYSYTTKFLYFISVFLAIFPPVILSAPPVVFAAYTFITMLLLYLIYAYCMRLYEYNADAIAAQMTDSESLSLTIVRISNISLRKKPPIISRVYEKFSIHPLLIHRIENIYKSSNDSEQENRLKWRL